MEKKIKAVFSRENVYSEDKESKSVYDRSRFGEPVENKIQYSLVEALYLLEKKQMVVYDLNKKKINIDGFIRRAKKAESNFWIRYCVFKDMRDRGYIIKTALKFGADFMVYPRGKKPGEEHAKWLLFPVHERNSLTWYDFTAKNRVAHSTRKNLLIGIVDDRGDVTYYEIAWTRP
jgi:tRNA-intron endonuclease